MRKFFALILAVAMLMTLAAAAACAEGDVYSVAYLVNGNLGDKSFFDSAAAGLTALEEAGRIECTTIEMGGTDEDQPTWLSTLYDVSASEEYDVIICGTYQMPDYLKEVATEYPEQKYVIFDDNTYVGENDNVLNLTYRQNDMGYLIGVFAASMTTDTALENINEDAVVGFVGGVDSPVINDFLIGFIEGAQSVNPDIKEAALETGKAWFIGVDSDQELTLSPDLAALTLTSGLKNIGNSLIWVFDELDAGNEYWGSEVTLGLAEGGVGIVTDKNFDKYASDDTKAAVTAAQEAVLAGDIVVDTAIGENAADVTALREAVRP